MSSGNCKRACVALSVGLACLSAAEAAPYWIEYDAASGVFPEQAGWTRVINAGGAQRWFEEGALVLDGRANLQITDCYQMHLPGALDPQPGYTFVVQWRMRVQEVVGLSDPQVTVFSDDSWAILFSFSETSVRSVLEPGRIAVFEAYIWHDFEVSSSDMRSYELRIDGEVAMRGIFRRVVSASIVLWGDGAQGSASLAGWDYFRFGVTPEPSSAVIATVLGTSGLWARRAGRRAA